MTEYYVRREGRIEGPWNLEKLKSEVRLRKLGKYHELSEDRETWQKAGGFDDLFPKKHVRKVVGGETKIHVPEETKTQAEPKVWYCDAKGRQDGPMTLTDIRRRIHEGELVLDDSVWCEGWDEWVAVEDVPEFTQEIDGDKSYTEATRMIENPFDKRANSKTAIASLALAILVFCGSCIPFVGFAGIGPMILGGFSIVELKTSKERGLYFAIAGVVLGAISVLLALLVMLVGVGAFTYSNFTWE